jgi:hypothetical protein
MGYLTKAIQSYSRKAFVFLDLARTSLNVGLSLKLISWESILAFAKISSTLAVNPKLDYYGKI